VKASTENSKATKQFQSGGDASVFFGDGWEKWTGTLSQKPAIISFTLKPVYELIPDKNKRAQVEAAVKDYLNYVGTIQNPGTSCANIYEKMNGKYSTPLDSGRQYIFSAPTSAAATAQKLSAPVYCDFTSSSGGGWTLVANKKGGWAGDFKPATAWAADTTVNSDKPSLISDYKLDFAKYFPEGQHEILLQYNSKAASGARVYRKFQKDSKWEYYTHPNTGAKAARREVVPDVGTSVKKYLVFSYDGGICIISPNFGDMFNCDGDNSQSKGQGLFDASSANEYANCDTFGWKHDLGGEDPEEYWSSSCDAIGGARDSRCSRGGKCVDSSCCATHFVSNSRGCGFLNMGCQPKCRLIKNQVNYCGSSFPAENPFVSVWFRQPAASLVVPADAQKGDNPIQPVPPSPSPGPTHMPGGRNCWVVDCTVPSPAPGP
jgi:hypothetical protein